jgi:hypothetical protein
MFRRAGTARRGLLTCTLALAFVFAIAGVASAATVSGQITAQETMQGLDGACVQLFDAAGDGTTPLQTVNADNTGHYTITISDISKSYVTRYYGCAAATIDRVEYWGSNDGSFDRAAAQHPIHFATQNQGWGINAFLYKGGVITGTVSQAGGSGVEGLCVEVKFKDYYAIYPGYSATTGPGGTYTIHAVRPTNNDGPYMVQFVDCRPTGDLISGYFAGEGAPLASTASGAASVSVAADQTVTADGSLTQGGILSGHVYREDGTTALANMCTYLSNTDESVSQSGKSAADGFYKFVVPAGTYDVQTYRCSDTPGKYVGNWQTGKVVVAGQVTTVDWTLHEDLTPPTIYITSGPAAGGTTGPTGTIYWGASESTTSWCAFDRTPDTSTDSDWCWDSTDFDFSGQPDGDHTLQVIAKDEVGNTSSTLTLTFHVAAGAVQTVSTGTLAAGDYAYSPGSLDATSGNPLTVRLKSPVAGTVTITSQANSTTAPSGWGLIGQELVVSAPDAPDAAHPLSFTFVVDSSQFTGDGSDVVILRNGTPIPLSAICTGGEANPDPCYDLRFITGTGDLRIDVLSTHASTWNVAKPGTTPPGGGGGGGGEQPSTPTTSTTSTTAPVTGTSPPASTPAATRCVVPKLVGLSLDKAKKALAKAHCGVGKIAKRAAAKKGKKKAKKGTVIAHNPARGTSKPAGSKVALTLAK